MLEEVVEEILIYREKSKLGKRSLVLEIAALIATSLVAYYAPISLLALTLYCLAYPILLAVLGLRKTSLYAVLSFAIFASITTLTARFLRGDVVSALKFSLVALATFSIGALILATLKPEIFRGNAYAYVLLVVLNHVFTEVRDVALSYKSRGESGLKLYLRTVIASLTLALARASTLADSLRARGFEVE